MRYVIGLLMIFAGLAMLFWAPLGTLWSIVLGIVMIMTGLLIMTFGADFLVVLIDSIDIMD